MGQRVFALQAVGLGLISGPRHPHIAPGAPLGVTLKHRTRNKPLASLRVAPKQIKTKAQRDSIAERELADPSSIPGTPHNLLNPTKSDS